MKRVAVIGLGTIAEIHIAILLTMKDRVTLCAVCDLLPEKSNLVPDVPFYTNYEEMMDKEKPDCVHLCLPHWLHYPVAKTAVKKGIHVFTEKPLALNTAEAKAFAQLEQDYPNIKIGLCLQNRFNETTQALLHILQSGNTGNILSAKGLVIWSRPKEYYTNNPWRGRMDTAGGGVLINQGIHTLDLMTYLCGEISAVTGNICQLLDYGIEVEDTATARLEFRNGAIGLFYATVANGENTNVELVITTEKCSYAIQDNKLYQIINQTKQLIAENDRLNGEKFYYGTGHAQIFNVFYEDLEVGGCRCPNAAAGVSSIRLIDAIRQSSNQQKQVQVL